MELGEQFGWVSVGIAVPTCLANGFLIYTLCSDKRLLTVTNIMIVSMAFSDLVVGVFTIPMKAFSTLSESSVSLPFACFCIQILSFYFSIISVYHLLAISVDRYCAIVYPFKYQLLFSRQRCAVILSFAWIFPLVYIVLPVVDYINFEHEKNQGVNETSAVKSGCQYAAWVRCPSQALIYTTVLLVFFSMIPLYVKIFWVAVKQIRKIHSTQTVPGNSGKTVLKEIRAFVVSAAVVYCFGLMYMPLISRFIGVCVFQVQDILIWQTTSVILVYFNSTVNPFIYGLGSREIRKAIFRKLSLKCAFSGLQRPT